MKDEFVLGPDGKPWHASKMEEFVDSADDQQLKKQLSNSYFFGQFFAMHVVLRIHDLYGAQRAIEFLEARYKSFVEEYPNYYNQMIKIDKEAAKQSENEYKKFLENQLDAD